MIKDQDTHAKLKLRQRAEEALQEQPVDASELSEEEKQHLIQELSVHQIELEMRNEELQRAQSELQAARDRYVDLYDFAPVGYFTISMFSEKGLVLEANLTLCAMLGVYRETLIHSRFSKFIHQKDHDIYYVHIAKLIKIPNKQTIELRLVRKDMSHFYAQLECVSVSGEHGNIDTIRVAATDITARKQAEQALKHAKDASEEACQAAEDANRAKSEFLSNMSH